MPAWRTVSAQRLPGAQSALSVGAVVINTGHFRFSDRSFRDSLFKYESFTAILSLGKIDSQSFFF